MHAQLDGKPFTPLGTRLPFKLDPRLCSTAKLRARFARNSLINGLGAFFAANAKNQPTNSQISSLNSASHIWFQRI